MSKQEMKNRIAELEKNLFFLAMKDRWNSNDYELDRKWSAEMRKLKNELGA